VLLFPGMMPRMTAWGIGPGESFKNQRNNTIEQCKGRECAGGLGSQSCIVCAGDQR
jgi:hypothetical protein